jgi:YidC/Oxa1 family membrane protein insertase
MPLTYKNYMSTAKTKVIKPEMSKITAKYEGKTDRNAAMKKQQETMALYKQTGVNPMAGCIPMIIQMPILFAVFRYFPASLDLRHKGFLWAEDLSSYDSILDFGFNIPIYGDHISLFALLMAGSTLIYSITNSNQMTPAAQPGMPNMKVIMYMMPIMLLFWFNTYSSGLSFYYFCGNLMNIGIMWGIKKYLIDEDKIRLQIESNKKKKKKKSRFQQRLEEVSKQQQKKRR